MTEQFERLSKMSFLKVFLLSSLDRIYTVQEVSLTQRYISARLQYVYEGPKRKIYSKSTIYYFLFMTIVTVAVLLTVSDTLSRIELENRYFRLLYY